MDQIKALIIKALMHVCAYLPLAVVRALGRLAGALYWPFGGRSKRVTLRNIELAFPQLSHSEQQRLARRSLQATAELAAEMGHVWLRSWEHVKKHIVRVEGAELVQDALASGRGVIALAPHLGNWEVVGLHLATLGPTVSLYEPPKLSSLGPMIERSRQRSGGTLVPTNSRGLARLLKSVRGGHISGILPDQCPAEEGSGLNVEFMGRPCFTGVLASNMIRRTAAVAVFCVAERVKGGFAVRYMPVEDDLYDEDLATSLAALNRGVEQCLLPCPEQYQWEYKRFRVRPKNGPGVYADC